MEEQTKNTIAVFDFDGTITTKDTLFDFIAFYYGKPKLLLGIALLSPILVLFKLGLLPSEKAKRIMFSYFYKGEHEKVFEEKSKGYIERINEITRPEAIEKIKWHQKEGHKVIIISASVMDWIKPWATSIGIEEVAGTGMKVENGKITGHFTTPNCHGKEKVNRLLAAYPNRATYDLYMYGDSSGDTAMLEIADYPFYQKF